MQSRCPSGRVVVHGHRSVVAPHPVQFWWQVLWSCWWQASLLQPSSASLYHLHQGVVFKHALATPLTTVSLSLEKALSAPPAESTRLLQQALTSTDYLCELTRSQNPKLKPFELKAAVVQALALVVVPNPIQLLHTVTVPSKYQLKGRRLYFQEALVCLITNACQAAAAETTNGLVYVQVTVRRRRCLIRIIDTGPGMNWITQKLVQLPGVTLKTNGHGWGLPFAKTVLVHQFKGQFTLRSQPRSGTTIDISLPLS